MKTTNKSVKNKTTNNSWQKCFFERKTRLVTSVQEVKQRGFIPSKTIIINYLTLLINNILSFQIFFWVFFFCLHFETYLCVDWFSIQITKGHFDDQLNFCFWCSILNCFDQGQIYKFNNWRHNINNKMVNKVL